MPASFQVAHHSHLAQPDEIELSASPGGGSDQSLAHGSARQGHDDGQSSLGGKFGDNIVEKADNGVTEVDKLMSGSEESESESDVPSESSQLSLEFDRRRLKGITTSKVNDSSMHINKVKLNCPKRRSCNRCQLALIYSLLVLLFGSLLLFAYEASSGTRSPPGLLLSNGTASFAPTTILVSLDGFRADFLDRGLTPTLNSFIAKGVSPPFMLPSFPSVTFPNHHTLVTGLYPESHGVVGNTFWDPNLKEEFYYTDPARSMQPKWWGGEPVWVTAELQGVKTAIHMWPGSEAGIAGVKPAYLDKYNGTEVLSRKVSRLLELLDLPGPGGNGTPGSDERPQLIAAYVPVVDADGHKYGPNSTEIRGTIKRVDDMLRDLLTGLEERNLTDVVNLVIVSDHGMATTSTDRLIQLDDIVDMDLIEHTDGWPLYGLRPKRMDDLQGMYDRLSIKAADSPNFDVYLRDDNMPERYHFSHNDRIAPLWIVPKSGWAIVTKKEFDVETAKRNGDVYHPRGLHGYDHEDPLMRAIFVAKGPSFPHQPNSRLEVFRA